jgi:hypothetical protein
MRHSKRNFKRMAKRQKNADRAINYYRIARGGLRL